MGGGSLREAVAHGDATVDKYFPLYKYYTGEKDGTKISL